MPSFTISDPGVPPSLHGPVLLDGSGRLRYWAAVDSFLTLGDLSTVAARLAGIERLYAYAEGLWVRDSLDAIIARQDLGRVHDLLHGFFARLRNGGLRNGHPSERAWLSARRFAVTVCSRLAQSSGPRRLRQVRDALDGLAQLDHHLAVGRRKRTQRPRALPAAVIEDLYELAAPASSRNPFRTDALRWRNYVIVLLLLHQGLRRGELLQLPVDAVKDDFDKRLGRRRIWLNVSQNPYERTDPRRAVPYLKNDLATRQIPISAPLADAIEAYVVNFRGKQSRSYLFSSQERKPLSVRALNTVSVPRSSPPRGSSDAMPSSSAPSLAASSRRRRRTRSQGPWRARRRSTDSARSAAMLARLPHIPLLRAQLRRLTSVPADPRQVPLL
jgi:integrase